MLALLALLGFVAYEGLQKPKYGPQSGAQTPAQLEMYNLGMNDSQTYAQVVAAIGSPNADTLAALAAKLKQGYPNLSSQLEAMGWNLKIPVGH